MLLVGGMVINLGDMFGLRRIWGGREGEGRAEIRVGGFFGGGFLWILMILVGLGKYFFLEDEGLTIGRCCPCTAL